MRGTRAAHQPIQHCEARGSAINRECSLDLGSTLESAVGGAPKQTRRPAALLPRRLWPGAGMLKMAHRKETGLASWGGAEEMVASLRAAVGRARTGPSTVRRVGGSQMRGWCKKAK